MLLFGLLVEANHQLSFDVELASFWKNHDAKKIFPFEKIKLRTLLAEISVATKRYKFFYFYKKVIIEHESIVYQFRMAYILKHSKEGM